MNNEEKNTFVKEQITEAMLRLLNDYEFCDISVCQVVKEAQVSRNSFYRNFADMENILLTKVRLMFNEWEINYKQKNIDSNAEMYGSLFGHFYDNRNFYLLLRKRNLFGIVEKVILEKFGAKEDNDNMTAYITSFIAHGTCGWIGEWLNRGMPESAEVMAAMLSNMGMK